MKLSKSVHENLVYVAVAMFVFLGEPAVLRAEVDYNPVNFTQPLKLSRGSLTASSRDGIYLSHEDTCRFLETESGWDHSDCAGVANLVLGTPAGVASFVVNQPNSDGFVTFDDWKEQDGSEIDDIWDNYVEGLNAQSRKLGIPIKPLRWYVYPTLNEARSVMYYAVLMDWNGQQTINAIATLFDRSGYVSFTIVPAADAPTEAQLEDVVLATLATYQPETGQSYSDFTAGDKVAAVGALGVLATLLGVKYGKGFLAAAIAIVALVAKKAWLLLVVSFVALKRFFKKRA